MRRFVKAAEDLLAQRKVSEPLTGFTVAEAQGACPNACSAGRWQAHMMLGDFAAAWRESDAIRERSTLDPNRFWNGEDIRGRAVVVRCLHGYGDAIQFLRYAPRLQQTASRLIVEVPPALLELAPFLSGVAECITWGEAAPVVTPAWDVQIEVMELPYLFRTTVADLPIAEDYLHLPGSVVESAARAVGARKGIPRIGVVWAAGDWNPGRSIPLECFQQLLQISGCEFWSLQGGGANEEWRCLPAPLCNRDLNCYGGGILRLAAAIEQMDLVITVDSLAAHLAGAMRKPAWVLLQHAADWRWMLKRNDSLWYPSLRLFRQPAGVEWDGLLRQVADELKHWITEAERGLRWTTAKAS